MDGSWTIRWSSGNTNRYIIKSTGQLSIDGTTELHLQESTSPFFPASKGWFTFMYMGEQYFMQFSDGLLQLHRFALDDRCTLTFDEIRGYCGSGEGILSSSKFFIQILCVVVFNPIKLSDIHILGLISFQKSVI